MDVAFPAGPGKGNAMSSVRTGSRSEGARGAGEGHMVWMGPGRTGGVAPWRDPCRGGGSFGIVEKGFRIQEEVGKADALVGEREKGGP